MLQIEFLSVINSDDIGWYLYYNQGSNIFNTDLNLYWIRPSFDQQIQSPEQLAHQVPLTALVENGRMQILWKVWRRFLYALLLYFISIDRRAPESSFYWSVITPRWRDF